MGIWMKSSLSPLIPMNARVSEDGTATVRTLEQVESLKVWLSEQN